MDSVETERALRALAEILARQEFVDARQDRSFLEVWSEALRAWLWELLLGFISPVSGAAREQRDWLNLAVVVAAVLVFAFVGWLVWRAVAQTILRDTRQRGAAEAARRARSDALWREAHRLAASGAWGEATRALYLSALYALEEHAVLRVQEGLTNREHASRLARERPGNGEPFADLVQRYDQFRYGGLPVDRAAFDELSRLVEQTRGPGLSRSALSA